MIEKIGHRIFTAEDLIWFAQASGDWNPIHVDRVRARRTLAGELVVHGMFSLLWALERHFKMDGTVPGKISAYFRRPIVPGEELAISREVSGHDIRLGISRKGEEVASVVLGDVGRKVDGSIGTVRPIQSEPTEKTFQELREDSGRVELTILADDVAREFTHVSQAIGGMAVAGIMAFSRVVGMKCPGLHSLFTGLELTLGAAASAEMAWKVTRHSSQYAPLTIGVSGGGMAGELYAFLRPLPVAQPSMEDVAKKVAPEAFVGRKALVIGGSRGLGELTAKVIAAGGGDVVITYRNGTDDARRVVENITAWGGKCRCVGVDVERPEMVVAALHGWLPNQLYYFATPKIGSQRAGIFDDALYASFHRVYVTAFEAILRAFADDRRHDLCVFYPSTVFVNEQPKGFAEYVAAKKAGELLCETMESEFPNLRILVDRLPRLKTDQTVSLIPQVSKAALPEIEHIVKKMKSLKREG
jgi:MaoC like domain/short chain dehydrogenase